MKTLKRLQTGAIAVTIAASAIFPALQVDAHPKRDHYNGHHHGSDRWNQNYRSDDRDEYRTRYKDYRNDDRDEYRARYKRQNRYNGYEVRNLPPGCRKVVVRDRTYYTRDNVYYTYNPERRAYIVVNLPSFGVRF